MIEKTYCNNIHCESNPSTCGCQPSNCATIALKQSLETLIFIHDEYQMSHNVSDKSFDDIQKSRHLIRVLDKEIIE